MEYNELVKHVAKLEAKCNALEKIMFELIRSNNEIKAPSDKQMSEEYNKQLDICNVKYKLL